MKERNANGII